jgi:CheY-like chemotaxis protein
MNSTFPSSAQSAVPPPDTTVHEPRLNPDEQELARWQELLAQAGRELAEPLTTALERVATLTTTGRIDRAGLRTLLGEVDRARQTGIWCQQISRLASGRVRQSHERVHLTNTVQSVLAHRARELQARGIHIVQSLHEVEVQVDASMLHGLLNAMVEWWLGCAQGTVDVRIHAEPGSGNASLVCQFQHRSPDLPQDHLNGHNPALESMSWHLLAQTARTLGVIHPRHIDASQARLTLEFPHTINALASDSSTEAPDAGFADSVNSKPLAGCHVLVVAARRDVRGLVRESMKSMGLVVDFVNSVSDAVKFCHEGLPHGIVFESSLKTPRFMQMVASIRQEVPEFVFIELLDEGHTFEISSISQTGMARVGHAAVATSLPSALVYELTRIM